MRAPSTAGRAGFLALLGSVTFGGCNALRQDGLAVTPQRPTFSSDTGTTAAGSFELEAGAVVDPGDSFSLPVTLKHGLGERSEAFLGFSPYNVVGRPGDDGEGFGDLIVGARHRFWESEAGTSTAFQVATKIPTGDEREGLSSGETDFFASAIVRQAVSEATSLTGYYELGVIGDPASPSTDTQHGLALAASHGLAGSTGLFAEVAGIFGPAIDDVVFTTVGLTETLAPSLVLDAGVAIGLNSAAPDVQFLVGVTTNLGRPGR